MSSLFLQKEPFMSKDKGRKAIKKPKQPKVKV